MSETGLLNIYKDVLRPSAEYSSVVYNTLIPSYIWDKLESVQKQACKIIYGMNVDYDKLLADGYLESLKDRRAAASLRFALKAVASPRFGDKWFKKARTTDIVPRTTTRRPYQEARYRTERDRNNPIQALTRALNEHFINS